MFNKKKRATAAEIADDLRKLVGSCKETTDLLELVQNVGATLAQTTEHEIQADHLNHALHLLPALVILERIKEILTSEDANVAYENYIAGAAGLVRDIEAQEAREQPDDIPADLPDILRKILNGDMEDVEIKVAQIRHKRKSGNSPQDKSKLN